MSQLVGTPPYPPPTTPLVVAPRVLLREQAVVTGAQLLAGGGNVLFALVMARVLTPGAFTDLAAFLVLYLLLHLPAAGLGAGGALAGASATDFRRRALGAGVVAGGVLALAAPALAVLLHLPVAMPLLLAAAAPAAGALALERGRCYGTGRHAQAAVSLAVEPISRIAAGIALAQVAGAPGAAAGVVLGGYIALLATRSRDAEVPGPGAEVSRRTRAAVAAFFLLAIVQNQDLLLAARVLPETEAARFAVLSTLGGIAAFATATVPLVLLPRAGEQPHAARVALLVAGALGGAATLAFVIGAAPFTELVFGERYAAIAPLTAPYVFGMSLLGVARVLAADRIARGIGTPVIVTTVVAAVVQAVLVLRFGTTAGTVAAVTIGTTAALAASLGVATVVRLPTTGRVLTELGERVRQPVVAMVAALAAGALALRLLITRGLWVDEAISVRQANLPFGQMLDGLTSTDVHPPLHASLLWVSVRIFGDGELAVRFPSLLAGVLLIPLLYVTARELFDHRTGVMAAALGAVSPLAIWYSQEARMYSLYMLFGLAAVLGQARALRRGGVGDWALYGIATAALLWTQYFGVLQVAAQQLVFAAAVWKRRFGPERVPVGRLLLGWLGALALAGVLLAPLLPFLGDQLATYGDRGSGLSGGVPSQAGNAASSAQSGLSVYAVIANLIWATGGYHADNTMAQIGALWPLAMLGTLALLGRRRSPATTGLLIVAAIPLGALFAIGLQRRDLFELRYVAGVVPILILLGARAVTVLAPARTWARIAAGTAVVLLLLGALADQQLNGTNPRLYDFRGALEEVSERAEPGDVILYNPEYLDEVVDYYAPDVESRPISAGLDDDDTGRVFLVGSFLDQPDIAGRTGDTLADLKQQRVLIDEFRQPQVRVWMFA